jgi:CHAD domain-containing protein
MDELGVIKPGALAAYADEVVVEDFVAAARRQYRRLRESVRAAEAMPNAENLHRVRVRTKRLRYSLETLEPVLHSSARAHAKALAALQDHLGEMQDADVIERWLRAARHAGGNDEFVLGELIGFELGRKAWVGATWQGRWKQASGRPSRRWSR